MGIYLNSKSAYGMFRRDYASTYYVDKTEILRDLVPLVELEGNEIEESGSNQGKGQKYVAITRPRRFGKTVMANMIASYFGKGIDSSKVFCNLHVAKYDWFKAHLNKHNVIHIMFNEMPDEVTTYSQYIRMIKETLLDDLIMAYPNIKVRETDSVWRVLTKIYEYYNGEKFIFVLDEWDFIYHQDFITEEDKKAFTKFLSNLLKDKAYVEMAYMTGILPIAKYSSGSELNMFFEFTMTTGDMFSEYFGFTDAEVDTLYERYQKAEDTPRITREGLELWYDGYQTLPGKRLYNPRSVVGALSYNQLKSYWTSSGPYDEIYYYVRNDISNIKDEIALMMMGTPIPANVEEYSSTSMKLTTRDEIYSAMVVYGFLSYADGYVSIPNKELMDKFADMVRQKPGFGYIYRLASESMRMLEATKAGDTDTMVEILERAHNTESPLNRYNDEAELSKIITFVYLQAREYYNIRLEEHSGTGYVDYIFYPYHKSDDGIIVELKVDDTVEAAIQQIKERNYMQNFIGKLGEESRYTGRILAVGIAYSRKDKNKRHQCKVEVLRGKLV